MTVASTGIQINKMLCYKTAKKSRLIGLIDFFVRTIINVWKTQATGAFDK